MLAVGSRLRRHLAQRLRKRLGYYELSRELSLARLREKEHVHQLSGALQSHCGISLPDNEARMSLLANLIGTSVCEGIYICDNLAKTFSLD